MKLRTAANSIRLRLSPLDLTKFSETGSIEEQIHFGPPGTTVFRYCLRRSRDVDRLAATFADTCLTVLMPAAVADEWSSSDEVGVEAVVPVGRASQLSILVEKDLECDVGRRVAHE